MPGDISDPQSLNRYAYVRDNPVRYADPSGEQFNEKADWGGGVAGLAAIGAAAGASSFFTEPYTEKHDYCKFA